MRRWLELLADPKAGVVLPPGLRIGDPPDAIACGALGELAYCEPGFQRDLRKPASCWAAGVHT